MDIIHQILAHNAGREPERLQLKYDRMRRDPLAFLRGTCHLFYRRRLPDDELFTDGAAGVVLRRSALRERRQLRGRQPADLLRRQRL